MVARSINPSAKPPLSASDTERSTRTPGTSAYDRNFEQKLSDHGFYYDFDPYPDNQKDIDERLARSRASLSPSRFNDDDFRKFKDAEFYDPFDENIDKTSVIPTLEGNIDDPKCVGGDCAFRNLAPLIKLISDEPAGTNSELAQAKPDRFYGARPEQLAREIRNDLHDQIIPSTRGNLPILPNFFLEAIGPDGSPAVVERQTRYNGALGARGMHSLQSYKRKQPTTHYHGPIRAALSVCTLIISSPQIGRIENLKPSWFL